MPAAKFIYRYTLLLAPDKLSIKTSEAAVKQKNKDKSSLDGPVVPGISGEAKTEIVSGQDEVDDLLLSLGF